MILHLSSRRVVPDIIVPVHEGTKSKNQRSNRSGVTSMEMENKNWPLRIQGTPHIDRCLRSSDLNLSFTSGTNRFLGEWRIYVRGQIRRIREEAFILGPAGTTKLYFRGLEIALPQARLERKQRIEHFTSMILREQLLERALHPQWIQNFYSRLTAPAVQAAHAMGLWDAQAVRAEELAETVSAKIQEVWI
jgi:hypothetical protein